MIKGRYATDETVEENTTILGWFGKFFYIYHLEVSSLGFVNLL